MANELDLQLFRAEAWDDLLRCLTTPRTGVAMIQWVDHTTLWQCWYGLSRQREHSRTETLIEDQLGAAWPAWRDHADATLSCDERALTFGSLSDFLMEYGGQCHALPLAAAAALDALDSENCEHFRADARQAIAFAIARLGDARRLHGDTSGAATLYQRALEQLRRLAPCPASDQDRLSVSFVIERMACIEESSFNSLGAIRLHYEALELRRSLHCDDDPWTRRRLIAGSEHNIGNLALSSGNIEDARTRFHESIGTLRQIPPELMRPADHLALAKTLGCLADSYIKSREYDEAKRLLYEALAACGRYGMCTATVEFESVCAVLFTRLGDVACTENDLQFADGCFQRSLFLSRRTYEGPHNSSRALGQCWAIHKLAELDVKRGDLAAARTRSREAIELCRSTALRMSTPDVDRCLATLLVGSAYLELHFGDTATAHELLQEALPHRRRLEESDRSSDARGDLATLLLLIADIEYRLGEQDSALAKYQESLEIARQLYAQRTAERDPEACNGVVWSAHLTGTCLIAMHRPVEALELLHTHAADAAKLEAECGDDLGHLNTCAAFWETFSAACSATGDSTAAATYAARAEGLRARIGAPQKPAGDSPA
jgi:tetratricopeptide (TPR) repeat protein